MEFSGYAGGAAKSVAAKFKRLITMEAAGSTCGVAVVDTDLGYIAGVSKAVTVTSNVAKIDSTATDEVDIGIVPQAANGRIWIYIIAPTGASTITTLAGICTIKLKGSVQKVGYGNM